MGIGVGVGEGYGVRGGSEGGGGRNQDGHSALVISFKHINVEII